MTLFIQTDAAGAGSGDVNAPEAFVNLAVIANGDTGLGFTDVSPRLQQITYARTLGGPPPIRLDTLVNTFFGVNPQNLDIIIVPVFNNFVLNDGRRLGRGGKTLSPQGSGMPGAELNTTTSCPCSTTRPTATGWACVSPGQVPGARWTFPSRTRWPFITSYRTRLA